MGMGHGVGRGRQNLIRWASNPVAEVLMLASCGLGTVLVGGAGPSMGRGCASTSPLDPHMLPTFGHRKLRVKNDTTQHSAVSWVEGDQ